MEYSFLKTEKYLMLKTILSVFLGGCVILMSSCSSKEGNKEESIQAPVKDSTIVENPKWGGLQNAEPSPFKLVLVDSLSLKVPEDFIMTNSYVYLNRDNDGNLYILDHDQNKLLSFDTTGGLNWITGQAGRGPGDFENVRGLLIDENYIYVGNMYGKRLDLFNHDGYFIRSFSLTKHLFDIRYHGFTDQHQLITSTTDLEIQGSIVKIFDLEADSLFLVREFVIQQSEDPRLTEMLSSHISAQKNHLFSSFMDEYKIQVTDHFGNILKTFTRSVDKITRLGIYKYNSSKTSTYFGGVYGVYKLDDGKYTVMVNWPTNVPDPDEYVKEMTLGKGWPLTFQNSIDIFDENGTLLYSVEDAGHYPDRGRFLYKDKSDLFYVFTSDPNPNIYRYKLTEH